MNRRYPNRHNARAEASHGQSVQDTISTSEILARCLRCIQCVPYHDRTDFVHPVTLITADPDGFAFSARVVVPREISDDLSYFRLNTRPETRKVAEIQKDARCSLMYWDQRGKQGWLTLKGSVTKVESQHQGNNRSVDLHFSAQKLEVMNYNEALRQEDGWVPIVLQRVGSPKSAWQRVMWFDDLMWSVSYMWPLMWVAIPPGANSWHFCQKQHFDHWSSRHVSTGKRRNREQEDMGDRAWM